MNLTNWLHQLPAIAALMQLPWFILLSVARVRAGGTSSLLLIKLIDLLIPLPSFAGLLLAAVLLWQTRESRIWLWCGSLACALFSAVFIRVLLS